MTAILDPVQFERERITSELHDRAIKGISAVALKLEALVEQSPGFDDLSPSATQTVLDCVTELRDVDRVVRNILEDLVRPQPRTLKMALYALAIEFNERAPTWQHVRANRIDEVVLAPDVVEELVLIATEALENALKHSEANFITIEAKLLRGMSLIMTVEDDGIGLQAEPVIANHFGLAGMASRARKIGAVFVTRRPALGCGTQVVTHLPLVEKVL
jgi:signal transduction histidine kinase